MARLNAIYGFAKNNVWIVGDAGVVLNWNGTIWKSESAGIPNTTNILDIHGVDAASLWVVGTQGQVFRRTGTNWMQVPSNTTEDLQSVWVRSQNEIWALGSGGFLYHSDGTTWTKYPRATLGGLAALWGDGTSVWAAGPLGNVLKYKP